jgi:colanic acid biosynthesis glycosyl transferase WcaI
MSFSISSFPVMLAQSSWKADLVWVVEPTFFCVPAALLAARISGAKAWLHIQDFELDMAFEMGLLPGSLKKLAFWLESFLMSKFDRVSTISANMLEKLVDKSVPRTRAVLFPNWVNTETIFPQSAPNSFRAELNIPSGATVVLYSGNLSMKQGLDVLLDAMHLLAAHSDIYPVICGDGPARSALRQLEGYSNVRILPLQPFERLNDLLNIADIHVLPQRADAADLVMPSKLTGMLASGRPVVATAHGGTQVARIVEKCGRVVPPGNAALLAESLLDLARDPLSRRLLGKAARNIAVGELDSHFVLADFQSNIMSLCGQSGKMAESAVPAH